MIRKSNTDIWVKTLFYFSTVAILIYVWFNTKNCTSLYADGTFELWSGLLSQKIYYFDVDRMFAVLPTAAVAIASYFSNILSLSTIIHIGAFSWAFSHGILMWISVYICYKQKKVVDQVITILLFCFTYTYAGFLIISEAVLAVPFFWLLFLIIYNNYLDRMNYLIKIVFLILVVFTFSFYSSFLFFNLLLMGLMIYQYAKKDIKRTQYNLCVFVLLALGALRESKSIIMPRDATNKANYIESIKLIEPAFLISISLIVIILFIKLCLEKQKVSELSKIVKFGSIILPLTLLGVFPNLFISSFKQFGIWLIITASFAGIYFIFSIEIKRLEQFLGHATNFLYGCSFMCYFVDVLKNSAENAQQAYNIRSMDLILPFGCAILLIILKNSQIEIDVIFFSITILFMITWCMFLGKSTNGYYNYLKELSELTESNNGFTDMDTLDYHNSYRWGWTSAYESIFAHELFSNNEINAIIKFCPDENIDHLYGTYNIEDYTWLEKYDVKFNLNSFR